MRRTCRHLTPCLLGMPAIPAPRQLLCWGGWDSSGWGCGLHPCPVPVAARLQASCSALQAGHSWRSRGERSRDAGERVWCQTHTVLTPSGWEKGSSLAPQTTLWGEGAGGGVGCIRGTSCVCCPEGQSDKVKVTALQAVVGTGASSAVSCPVPMVWGLLGLCWMTILVPSHLSPFPGRERSEYSWMLSSCSAPNPRALFPL